MQQVTSLPEYPTLLLQPEPFSDDGDQIKVLTAVLSAVSHVCCPAAAGGCCQELHVRMGM